MSVRHPKRRIREHLQEGARETEQRVIGADPSGRRTWTEQTFTTSALGERADEKKRARMHRIDDDTLPFGELREHSPFVDNMRKNELAGNTAYSQSEQSSAYGRILAQIRERELGRILPQFGSVVIESAPSNTEVAIPSVPGYVGRPDNRAKKAHDGKKPALVMISPEEHEAKLARWRKQYAPERKAESVVSAYVVSRLQVMPQELWLDFCLKSLGF